MGRVARSAYRDPEGRFRSVESVRTHLARFDLDAAIREFDDSAATVELAAARLETDPAHIAKTLAFYDPAGPQDATGAAILIVMAGDARVNSGRFKQRFGAKPRMLAPDDLVPLTGHPMGGVCPFAVAPGARVWLDESLRRFEVVYPAAGSHDSAVPIEVAALEEVSGALGWVDLGAGPREESADVS